MFGFATPVRLFEICSLIQTLLWRWTFSPTMSLQQRTTNVDGKISCLEIGAGLTLYVFYYFIVCNLTKASTGQDIRRSQHSQLNICASHSRKWQNDCFSRNWTERLLSTLCIYR
jgi:hypothetical protein